MDEEHLKQLFITIRDAIDAYLSATSRGKSSPNETGEAKPLKVEEDLERRVEELFKGEEEW